MNAPVLAALEARAGVSDVEREAWLAARRAGITATEIRDLKTGRLSVERLVNLKLGREIDTFNGNEYTDWGTAREPIIADMVEQRFGIRPESRVFHAADDHRKLASPDGVGMYGFDEQLVVSEIKTSGVPVPPWSDAYAAKGYEFQQQWVMRVLGAERSLFVWEIRERGADGQFYPGELSFEWVYRNETLIAELDALADEFLVALDKAAAEPWDGPAPVDEFVDTQAVNYLRGLQLEKDGAELKRAAYKALLEAGVSQVSAMARVTYTPEKPGVVVEVEDVDFDAAWATEEGAALWEAFLTADSAWREYCEQFKSIRRETGKGTPARVTVTPVKTLKEK